MTKIKNVGFKVFIYWQPQSFARSSLDTIFWYYLDENEPWETQETRVKLGATWKTSNAMRSTTFQGNATMAVGKEKC
jgi:hypothetical protein